MRRVDLLVVAVDGHGGLSWRAQGVGHRMPCVRVVPPQVAAELYAAGVPVVIQVGSRRSAAG
jgi:hypothetical protein